MSSYGCVRAETPHTRILPVLVARTRSHWRGSFPVWTVGRSSKTRGHVTPAVRGSQFHSPAPSSPLRTTSSQFGSLTSSVIRSVHSWTRYPLFRRCKSQPTGFARLRRALARLRRAKAFAGCYLPLTAGCSPPPRWMSRSYFPTTYTASIPHVAFNTINARALRYKPIYAPRQCKRVVISIHLLFWFKYATARLRAFCAASRSGNNTSLPPACRVTCAHALVEGEAMPYRKGGTAPNRAYLGRRRL